MRILRAALVLLTFPAPLLAQAVSAPPQAAPPTLEEVRRGMGIPSVGLDLRGQQDAVGFASRPDQMAKVWELSAAAPAPESLGDLPAPGVAGAICPHDDYLYAGRVYRQVLPLVTAKRSSSSASSTSTGSSASATAWCSTPTARGARRTARSRCRRCAGRSSPRFPEEDWIQDAAMHDSEHSLEALVYYLRHARPDLEIVPILVPAASFPRLREMAEHLGTALASACALTGGSWAATWRW